MEYTGVCMEYCLYGMYVLQYRCGCMKCGLCDDGVCVRCLEWGYMEWIMWWDACVCEV